MSEDAHNSENGGFIERPLTPEEYRKYMSKSSGGIKSSSRREALHLGRWDELTLEDFQFLYACGVSSD